MTTELWNIYPHSGYFSYSPTCQAVSFYFMPLLLFGWPGLAWRPIEKCSTTSTARWSVTGWLVNDDLDAVVFFFFFVSPLLAGRIQPPVYIENEKVVWKTCNFFNPTIYDSFEKRLVGGVAWLRVRSQSVRQCLVQSIQSPLCWSLSGERVAGYFAVIKVEDSEIKLL